MDPQSITTPSRVTEMWVNLRLQHTPTPCGTAGVATSIGYPLFAACAEAHPTTTFPLACCGRVLFAFQLSTLPLRGVRPRLIGALEEFQQRLPRVRGRSHV